MKSTDTIVTCMIYCFLILYFYDFFCACRDIASAIKNLLDAVNNVFPYVNGPGSRPV